MRALFLRTALWIFVALLAGRLLGFVREILIARQFGVSATADTMMLMTLAPDFFTNLILGTALAGSFIPLYNKLASDARHPFYQTVASKTLIIGLVLWLVGAVLAPVLVNSFAGSLTGALREQAIGILRLDLAVIPLTLLAGIFVSHLQAQLKQVAPAFATAVFNTVLVAGLLFYVQSPADWVLCLIAAAIARCVYLWLMNSQGRRWITFQSNPHWSAFIGTYATVWLGSALFLTCIPLIARALASQLGEGELALFTYAHKLVELPQGLLISVIGVTLLPQLSKLHADASQATHAVQPHNTSQTQSTNSQTHAFQQLASSVILYTIALSSAVAFVLFAVSFAYAQLVFGFVGSLDDAMVTKLASIVGIGVMGMPALGIIAVGNATLLSQHKARLMLMINICCVAFFIVCIAACFALDAFSRTTIMLSLVLSSALAAILMLYQLSRANIILPSQTTLTILSCALTGTITAKLLLSASSLSWQWANASVTQFSLGGIAGMILLTINVFIVHILLRRFAVKTPSNSQ